MLIFSIEIELTEISRKKVLKKVCKYLNLILVEKFS